MYAYLIRCCADACIIICVPFCLKRVGFCVNNRTACVVCATSRHSKNDVDEWPRIQTVQITTFLGKSVEFSIFQPALRTQPPHLRSKRISKKRPASLSNDCRRPIESAANPSSPSLNWTRLPDSLRAFETPCPVRRPFKRYADWIDRCTWIGVGWPTRNTVTFLP